MIKNVSSGSGPYNNFNVYSILLSQSGAVDPTVTILQNNLGPIVCTRNQLGVIDFSCVDLFTTNKTAVIMPNIYYAFGIGEIPFQSRYAIISTSLIQLYMMISGTDTFVDSNADQGYNNTFFEIRVYP